MKTKYFRAAFACFLISIVQTTAAASDMGGPTFVISRDNGGSVVEYVRAVSRARRKNAFVRFEGQCASSCTLFLSLGQSHTCITRNVSFLFHRASGAQADVNNWSTDLMIEHYPQWVRQWISANGGLTDRLIRMDYAYASRYVRPCANT
jgi:hypothetical protein